jgi:hypothetical protein
MRRWRYADFRPMRTAIFPNELQAQLPKEIRSFSDKANAFFGDLPISQSP